MKKSLILLGSVILIIIILFVIKSFNGKDINDKDYLKKYLDDNGYKQENDLYTKVATDKDDIKDATNIDEYDKNVGNNSSIEYTTLTLNPDKFIFKRENRTFSDDIEKIYTGTIDLKKDKVIKFDYMINIYTSQIVVEGSYEINNDYDEKDFKCSLYYQSWLDEDKEELENIYCSLAKVETLDFVGDINNLNKDKKIYSMINE